jgi:Family of unknown function (DUF6703)
VPAHPAVQLSWVGDLALRNRISAWREGLSVTRNQAGRPGQQARPGRQGRPAGRGRPARPLPRGDTLFTPDVSQSRQAFERQSAAALLWLHQLPVWLLPLIMVGLLVTGFTLHGVAGAIALCAVAAVLGWLAALSWPRLSGQGRLLRAAAVACVLIAAVIQLLRR